ncbi:MAG: ABC transporter permease [Fulvivirga sp.]|uniref:ABC transporter permease n=1 Tax=Fulvivirga sp. TaxID=1931237 RepID=UPI0032EB44B6
MLKNYLKIAWRNLLQHKTFALINIAGLGVGFACIIIIGMWIQHELSYDSFHPNGERIGTIRKHVFFNNEKSTNLSVPLPLYEELKTNYPEIKHISRMSSNFGVGLMTKDHRLIKEGIHVDRDFLRMFNFPIINGNMKNPLENPNAIILTKSLAETLFGKEDPIGKIIKRENKYDLVVTAVMADVPDNSTITFDFLAPFEFLIQTFPFFKNNLNNWGSNFLFNIVELKENTSMQAFSEKLKLIDSNKTSNGQFFIHSLKKWHLYDQYENWKNVGGKIRYVILFSIIGLFILLIACFNFVNLSTARSEKRSKEVGIRKAIGSRKKQLISQFLTESVLTCCISFVLALVLIQLFLPLLHSIGFDNVALKFDNKIILIAGLVIITITGLAAGSYPAFYLSSFNPVQVLKGSFNQGHKNIFRRTLVICQFTLSVFLVVCTILVYQQIQHARNRPLGYNPSRLITLGTSPDLVDNFNLLKTEMLNSGYVQSMAKSSGPMTYFTNIWSTTWEGKNPEEDVAFGVVLVGYDYLKTMQLELIKGRPFSETYNDQNSVILTEAALKVTGYQDPIGKTLEIGSKLVTIIGIVKDVLISDPFKNDEPAAIMMSGNKRDDHYISFRLRPEVNIQEAMTSIKSIFDLYNPTYPFGYSFVEDDFDEKFQIESQLGKLSGVFSILAIFMSSLGLFGLSMYLVERRLKEIGIRKVLGSSILKIWTFLSGEFAIIVSIGCFLAFLLSYFFMENWLQDYYYRITISWWVFVVSGIGALFIALMTVSFQTIKAAVVNPAKILKSE